MKCLTIFKDNEIMISLQVQDTTMQKFLSYYPASNSNETIPKFIKYLSQVIDSLYGIGTTIELKIEKLRNQEKVTSFSELKDMIEFYGELTREQDKLYDLHQEIGKIEAIMDLVITQNEESEKEPEWSIDLQ